MKNYKHGFTMTEILISLVVIGVIIAVSVPAINRATSTYTSLTYQAYNNMQTIIKSMWEVNSESTIEDLDGNEHGREDVIIDRCTLSDGSTWTLGILKPDILPPPPSSSSSSSSSSTTTPPTCNINISTPTNGNFNFCDRVASMANIIGQVNCQNLKRVSYTNNSVDGYEVPYIEGLNTEAPNFVASNGQRWYFSERVVNPLVSNDFGFRLIAIDLNGKRGPNVLSPRNNELEDNNKKKLPDIVTFLILDNGVIYPIGVAGNNKRLNGETSVNYLNTRIKAYAYSKPYVDNENNPTQDVKCLYGDTNFDQKQQEDAIQEYQEEKDQYKQALEAYHNDPDNLPVPVEPKIKNPATQESCKFTVDYLPNNNGTSKVDSFRQKFCQARQEENQYYTNYCSGIDIAQGCPGSNSGTGSTEYDECYVEPVKPLFRFNL